MPRYKLRTLLILLAVLPPIIAGVFHYRNWRALQFLRSLERAQIKRDQLLETWRAKYDLFGEGQEEAVIREPYFTARQDFEKQRASIKSQYGSIEAAMRQGAQAQQFER